MPELSVPKRLLLGPGPSDADPAVLRAMAQPLVGHLDPFFLKLMDEVRDGLREVFGTKNELTFPISATGSAGMETIFVNLLEPGDRVLIGVNGVFGGRMCDVASRCGAEVVKVEAPWGRIIDPDDVRKALREKPFKMVALVHAETSTGALQPVEDISRLAHEQGALLGLDCVTSLGGLPVELDKWGVDACYSGTQKCLSAPPGLSPVSFSNAAIEKLKNRKSKVQSWYLDMNMIRQYWGKERVYHHTAPITMIYALREALRLTLEEGLEARFRRHAENSFLLMSSILPLGFQPFAQEGHRLPMLNSVFLPPGKEDAPLRKKLLEDHGIEVGGGLGAVKGKIWRIGLMGHSSRREKVERLVAALKQIL